MEQENIIWKTKPSQLLNWPMYLLYFIAAIFWFFLPKHILQIPILPGFFENIYSWHLFLGFSSFLLIPFLFIFLKTYFIRYELSNERFIIYSGVFTRSREVIELYRVKDFNVISPFYIRLFSFSNITIHTSDKTCPILEINAISNAYKIEDLIRENVENMRKIKGVREFD